MFRKKKKELSKVEVIQKTLDFNLALQTNNLLWLIEIVELPVNLANQMEYMDIIEASIVRMADLQRKVGITPRREE